MLEDMLIWITSESVLGTLFDGVLGAAIGAGVAVFVLRKTLNEQRLGLIKQLDKQDNHHQEQLRIQREENSRARLHDVIADLLGNLTSFTQTVNTQSPDLQNEITEIGLKMNVNLERFNLDVPLYDLGMYGILSGLTNCALKAAKNHGNDRMPAHLVLTLGQLSGAIGAYLVEWARSEGEEREEFVDSAYALLQHVENTPQKDWPSGMPENIRRAGTKQV